MKKLNYMKKQFVLSVPDPCSEKWSSFTPTANGRFCSSCSKSVVDFTSMSDDAIVDFISKKNDKVCGRFHTSQLKSYSHSPHASIHIGWHLLRMSFLVLLVGFINNPSFSRPLAIKTHSATVQYDGRHEEKSDTNLSEYSVKGIVKDKGDVPLPGVNIYLKGTTIGTVSDENGKFEFPKKLKAGDTLVFSFIGLETKEYVVSTQTKEPIEISLAFSTEIMMGAVAVNEVYTRQPSTIHKWWSKVMGIF
jgi:CarboxypepD_reg-like domain